MLQLREQRFTVNVYSPAASDADAKLLSDKIKELMGKGYTDAKSKMTSAQGKKQLQLLLHMILINRQLKQKRQELQ